MLLIFCHAQSDHIKRLLLCVHVTNETTQSLTYLVIGDNSTPQESNHLNSFKA